MGRMKQYVIFTRTTIDKDFTVEAHNIPEARKAAVKLANELPAGTWNKSTYHVDALHKEIRELPGYAKQVNKKQPKVEVMSV